MPLAPIHNLATVQELLKKNSAHQYFLLFDQNTVVHCDPLIRTFFPELNTAKRIIIPASDESKTLEKCQIIWDNLLTYGATTKSILINVGGGMITDIGGFCAASFKRGIDFINIPTSLLGMVDASIGGKTGVNFRNAKNQIGVFADPVSIYINPLFLQTLPRLELNSGLAEMLKHEFLFNPNAIIDILSRKGTKDWTTEAVIMQNVAYKQEVVQEDYYDQHRRQCLNFGHTIGHAIEAFSHDEKTPLLHGEAVLLGMIEELKLSEALFSCPTEIRELAVAFKDKFFPLLDFKYSLDNLLPYLLQDKKNDAAIRFSLLEDIAKPKIQVAITLQTLENELV